MIATALFLVSVIGANQSPAAAQSLSIGSPHEPDRDLLGEDAVASGMDCGRSPLQAVAKKHIHFGCCFKEEPPLEDQDNAAVLAVELTIAWLSNANTRVSADEVPAFLTRMHEAVSGLSVGAMPAAEPATEYTPAVTARKSLASKDYIISLIDGKPYKTLRRHLSGHGLTPEQYRERYNLKSDYPMVAETYSQHRRDMAKKIGLGRKAGEKAPVKGTRGR